MQYIRDIYKLSRALFSVLVICVLFLFSSQSFAKTDLQPSLLANNVNVELNSIELHLDDKDSCDPLLFYKSDIYAAIPDQRVVNHTFAYIPAVNTYSINVRAPPFKLSY